MLLIIMMTLVTLMKGCKEDKTLPSHKEMVGVYMGDYFGGIETFILNEDGTFSQEFKKKGVLVYKSQGKWESDADGGIAFEPFMSPAGAWTGYFEGPPDSVDVAHGSWHRGPIRIMFFEDAGYWVVKVEGTGATSDRKIIERAYD
jgi:hypothetical protein